MSNWFGKHCGQLSVICTMIDCPSELHRPAYWPPLFMHVISMQALQQQPVSPAEHSKQPALLVKTPALARILGSWAGS